MKFNLSFLLILISNLAFVSTGLAQEKKKYNIVFNILYLAEEAQQIKNGKVKISHQLNFFDGESNVSIAPIHNSIGEAFGANKTNLVFYDEIVSPESIQNNTAKKLFDVSFPKQKGHFLIVVTKNLDGAFKAKMVNLDENNFPKNTICVVNSSDALLRTKIGTETKVTEANQRTYFSTKSKKHHQISALIAAKDGDKKYILSNSKYVARDNARMMLMVNREYISRGPLMINRFVIPKKAAPTNRSQEEIGDLSASEYVQYGKQVQESQ